MRSVRKFPALAAAVLILLSLVLPLTAVRDSFASPATAAACVEETAPAAGAADAPRTASEKVASSQNYFASAVSSTVTAEESTAREDCDIVTLAEAQIGNVNGEKFWSWYGLEERVEWCACFVSWCAAQSGYIAKGTCPKYSYCPDGAEWFMKNGRWQYAGTEPEPGMIVFFDWEGDGIPDHTGIVERVDGNCIYTVEGNVNNCCLRVRYSVHSNLIYGYGFIE